MSKLKLSLLALLLAGAASAQEPGREAVDAPPPPPPVRSGEPLDPDVTIVQQDDRTIYEYRVNGQTYMVKVVPAKGPPPEAVVFEFPELRRIDGAIEELAIETRGAVDLTAVLTIDLLHQPELGFLPPHDDPRLVGLDRVSCSVLPCRLLRVGSGAAVRL
mgnify:CR=1 FL=1